MTVNALEIRGKNIDGDANVTAYIDKGVVNSDPDNIVIL